jgi:hypothetical protein
MWAALVQEFWRRNVVGTAFGASTFRSRLDRAKVGVYSGAEKPEKDGLTSITEGGSARQRGKHHTFERTFDLSVLFAF